MSLSNGSLTGIRLVDASTVLATPFAASLLGDMGAEVIIPIGLFKRTYY